MVHFDNFDKFTDIPQNCFDLAEDLANDPNVPDWFIRNNVEFFHSGGISCEDLFDGAVNLANRNIIGGEVQQDLQLIQLGIETTRRANEIKRQAEYLEELRQLTEEQRIADNLALQELNERLSGIVTQLGEGGSGGFDLGSFGLGGLAGGGIVTILVLALILRGR